MIILNGRFKVNIRWVGFYYYYVYIFFKEFEVKLGVKWFGIEVYF